MLQVWMLSMTQALCMSGSFLFVLLGGIIGSELAPAPGLATLPVSVLILGLAANVLPAGMLVRRLGRRPAFVISALLAGLGCIAAGIGIRSGNFWIFCGSALLLGANNAMVMQYRFAATEYVAAARASKAIAVVMSGALVAAWLGPEIAVRAADAVEGAHYAGSFFAGTGLYLLAAILLTLTPVASGVADKDTRPPRPLATIIAQTEFRIAVLAALVSYAVMSFIMTATPISMHVIDHHDEVSTKQVIQAHLLAMYLPSFASGWFISRFGVRPALVAGTLLMTACVVIDAFAGHAVLHYGWALALLGVGWNLLFIAGTTLLTRCYRPQERFQVQTLNDFMVFGAQALASLMAGVALATIGWQKLNLATLPLLAAVLLAVTLAARRQAGADLAVQECADLRDQRRHRLRKWRGEFLVELQQLLRRRLRRPRTASEDQTTHHPGPERGEFAGDPHALAAADQVHLAQAHLVDQVGNRGGQVHDRQPSRRPVRCAAARQVRRIDRAIGTEQCCAGIEIGAAAAVAVQEQERRLLVEAAARRKGRGQVQLAVAAIHVHAPQGCHRRLPDLCRHARLTPFAPCIMVHQGAGNAKEPAHIPARCTRGRHRSVRNRRGASRQPR